jgi:hypothetical protein
MEPFAMPEQERIGLDNEQCIFPILYAAGKHEQREAIAAIELGPFNLALQNAKLLAEQAILKNEFGFGVGEVCESPAYKRLGRRPQECAENLFKSVGEWAKEEQEKGNERDS